MVIAH